MIITCPLCGYKFKSDLNQVCKGCVLQKNCDKVCCPNCHYGWVESSPIVSSIIRKITKRRKVGKS